MNSDTFKGKWKQLQSDVKIHWAKLTDDDLAVIDGNIDKLVGRIQEIYGDARESIHVSLQSIVDKVQAAIDKDNLKQKNLKAAKGKDK